LAVEQFVIGRRAPLFFMHIPKTAGMSIRLYLQNQYPAADIMPARDWHEVLRSGHLPSAFRLAAGHFAYNLRFALAAGTPVLTVLRDPVARTISALKHLRRDPDFHPDHALADGMSLRALIRNPAIMSRQNNIQAAYLCASSPPATVLAYLGRTGPQATLADPAALEAPPSLALAQERLRAIEFVGHVDGLETLLSDLADAMNFHPAAYIPYVNQDPSAAAAGLDDEDLAMIRHYNAIDIALYAYSLDLLRQRQFEKHMARLVASGCYQVPAGPFEIDLGGIIPGSGWYNADRDDGTVWRWTGPAREFSVELALRSDRHYDVDIMTSHRPDTDRDISAIAFNGQSWAFTRRVEQGCLAFTLGLPAAALAAAGGLCRLVFTTSPPRLPENSADQRLLGIAVRRIEFACR
jgi:hypothetical protein